MLSPVYTRGQILRRNPDKSLKSFPPCYLVFTVTSKQLWLEISISSTHATSYSFCTGKWRKTWKKPISLSLWFKKYIQKPHVWELSRLCLEISLKFYIHEFGLGMHSHKTPLTDSTMKEKPRRRIKGDIVHRHLTFKHELAVKCVELWMVSHIDQRVL